jgi:hypothetical protein
MSIVVGISAELRCDAEGCKEKYPAELCLTQLGTMVAAVGPEPKVLGWDQAAMPPSMVFVVRCPAHPFSTQEKRPISSLIQPVTQGQRVQVGPAGIRPLNGHGGKG